MEHVLDIFSIVIPLMEVIQKRQKFLMNLGIVLKLNRMLTRKMVLWNDRFPELCNKAEGMMK